MTKVDTLHKKWYIIIETLIKAGADVTANENEALIITIVNGYADILEIILKEKKQEIVDYSYAIELATQKEHKKILNMLKEAEDKQIENLLKLLKDSRDWQQVMTKITKKQIQWICFLTFLML